MTNPHYRRCWDCGAIALHTDNVTPEVLCKRCRSQDTRMMKNEPPLWVGLGSIREGRGLYVPEQIARCPECGMTLIAECHEHELGSGRPVATGIELTCKQTIDDVPRTDHSYTQDKWQPVRDAVAKWCDARVDYPGK